MRREMRIGWTNGRLRKEEKNMNGRTGLRKLF
jgi:hypothetical protein